MTLSEPMERDLRLLMRRLRAHGTIEVYIRRSLGVLRLYDAGRPSERVAGYAVNWHATMEDIADMIREDVAHEVAEQCR